MELSTNISNISDMMMNSLANSVHTSTESINEEQEESSEEPVVYMDNNLVPNVDKDEGMDYLMNCIGLEIQRNGGE